FPRCRAGSGRGPRMREQWRSSIEGYLYLFPALLVLLAFHILPIFYAFYISLFSWRIAQGPFVGLANYGAALTNPEFWDSLKVTVYYAVGVIIGGIVLSVLIGYALSQR